MIPAGRIYGVDLGAGGLVMVHSGSRPGRQIGLDGWVHMTRQEVAQYLIEARRAGIRPFYIDHV